MNSSPETGKDFLHSTINEETNPWSVHDPEGETTLNTRHIRNINRDHGGFYPLDTVEIRALEVFDSDTYAGGMFALDSDAPEGRVVKWNGTGWVEVGGAFNGPVYCLEVVSGILYAGGAFTMVDNGGQAAVFLAQYDSGNGDWDPLPDDSGISGSEVLDGPVRALLAKTIMGTDYVYVGGEFTHLSGDTDYSRIARFRPSSPQWSALDSGLTGPVYALASGSSSNVYVGGDFSSENVFGFPVLNNIARWTGASWSAYSSGSGIGANGPVHAIISFDSGGTPGFYIGGNFSSVTGNTPVNSIAKYLSSSWSALGNGVSGSVKALYKNASYLYVGGDFNTALSSGTAIVPMACRIAAWSGSAWSALDEGLNGTVFAIQSDPDTTGTDDDIVVGGRFQEIADSSGSNIVSRLAAHWSGSAWSEYDGGDGTGGDAGGSTRFDEAIAESEHLMRRSVEHLLKVENGLTTHLPRVDRAELTVAGTSGWTIRVRTADLPAEPVAFRVHVAFSDDRDFRRFDGPGATGGLVDRNPTTLQNAFPEAEGRYYNPDEANPQFGANAIFEAPLTFERASAFRDTKSWEDRFYTITPTNVTGPSSDFFTLTFNPPSGYPWGGSNLLVGCVVEMRVGETGDGVWDDVAMTEVAFANQSYYAKENTEDVPDVDNSAAEIALVLPARARINDYIYIVGTNFIVRNDSDDPSGIENVVLTFTDPNPDQPITLIPGDDDIKLISSGVIRVQLSGIGSLTGPVTVTVNFEDGGSDTKGAAIVVDSNS